MITAAPLRQFMTQTDRSQPKGRNMIEVRAIKASFTWKADNLPKIDARDPVFEVASGDLRISARISPKSARKLLAHTGGGKIEGRLALIDGRLELENVSVQLFDPKPATVADGQE